MGKRPFDTKDLNEFLDVINEEKLFFPIIAELDTLHAEVTNSQKMLIFNEIYWDFDEEIIEYLWECRFDNLYWIAMMQAKEFAIEIISKKNNLKKWLWFCIQIIEQVESVLLKYWLSRWMSSEEIEKMKWYDF